MKRRLTVILVMVLMLLPLGAKEKKIPFDAQAALSYLKVLASDDFLGRESGELGGKLAEEYIASKFKEWGLEPAGDNGTYFQNFTIAHSDVAEGVVFEIISPRERRNFYYREDWRVQRYSGSGHLTTEIVFVGYGVHAPEKGYDDYEGVDVKGKIVLMATDSPERLRKKVGEEALKLSSRVEAAQKLGAKGIIFFRSPSASSAGRYFRARVDKKLYKPDFLLLSAENKVVEFIFKDLPIDTRTVFSRLNRQLKPQSLATGVKVFVSVNACFNPETPTRNVLAKISGTDKKLKDEYVIIGAHMDHLGVSPMGDIYNGANDNGSGTVVVMELARAMKQSGFKPKRTVVFALWAGEEQGLLGSRYFADHPTPGLPIEKAVVNINLDMVGIGSGKINFGGKYYAPEIWKFLKENLPKEVMDFIVPGRGGPGGSDHTSFLMKGVPAFFGITQDSFLKYHHPRDEWDLIQAELIQKTGNLVWSAITALANTSQNFIQPRRQEIFYMKYQDLINYRFSPLDNVVKNHGDAQDSHVDLQMAVVSPGEGTGDQLFLTTLKNLLVGKEKIRQAKGLKYLDSIRTLSGNVRQGKTSVIAGVKGLAPFQSNTHWAEILSKSGLYFVLLEDSGELITNNQLTKEAENTIKSLNKGGVLIIARNFSNQQAQVLLKASSKPLVLLAEELPSPEVLKLIKEKQAALGLVLGPETDPAAYFEKLEAAKKELGSRHLMLVNDVCYWGDDGQSLLLDVIAKMLKAKYESSDLRNIFSQTFIRVIQAVRGDTGQMMMYRPF